MSPLQSRRQCQVVIFRGSKVKVPRLSAVLNLARALEIPISECTAQILTPPVLEEIKKRLQSGSGQDRHTIMICGSYLEEQILIAVQYLLAIGFNVYLLRDLILPMNEEHAQIHDSRLLQAGAIETTSAQVAYEWMALESDRGVSSILAKFLQS